MGKGDKTNPSKPTNGDYEVGYQKTPVSTRFAKGVSGNPKGRARGAKSLRTSLQAILNQKVTTRVGDKVRSMSKADAILSMMVNAALKGDFDTGLKALSLAGRLESDAAKELQRRKVRVTDLSNEEFLRLFVEKGIPFTQLLYAMTDEQLVESEKAIEAIIPPKDDNQMP